MQTNTAAVILGQIGTVEDELPKNCLSIINSLRREWLVMNQKSGLNRVSNHFKVLLNRLRVRLSPGSRELVNKIIKGLKKEESSQRGPLGIDSKKAMEDAFFI